MLAEIRNPNTAVRSSKSAERPPPHSSDFRFQAAAFVSAFGFRISPLLLVTLLLIELACGCAGRCARAYSVLPDNGGATGALAQARTTLAQLYPPQYRATQRAIITIGRKQFVCDGVLTVSPEEGQHLAVVSTLGLVTEVRVETNGAIQLVQVTPLFKETWSREFVSRDLRQLFAPHLNLEIGGRLPDERFVLENRPTLEAGVCRYIFTPLGDRLEEMEIARAGRRFYHVSVKHYRQFAGFPRAIPSDFDVVAPDYRLELRTAELAVLEPGAARAAATSPP
jgi:hypothetical protein